MVGIYVACSSDDGGGGPITPTPTAKGSIFVTVTDQFANVVAGATVLTNPETERPTTDALGTALISDVEPGTYTVSATHPARGSARVAATVGAGKAENVPLELVPGVFLQPLVSIFEPTRGSQYSYVDSLTLRGSVTDAEDASNDLDLVWRSSLDGVLSSAPAQANGTTLVERGPLSQGDHWISLMATDSDGFSGKDSVNVSVRSFSPVIADLLPPPGTGFVPGEQVTFSATITDRETPATQLQVEWRSDLDDVINTDAPAGDGSVSFSTTTLSRGVHQVTVKATDGDANETSSSVTIPNNLPQRVVLNPLTKDVSGITLTWTPVSEPDFASYRIYRATNQAGPFSLIDILNNAGADTYKDTSVEFGRTYWYQLGLLTTAGPESFSNVESLEAGISIAILTQVETMMVDPVRPFLYALDRVNNSLVFVDLSTNSVESTIFVGSSPTDMDIDIAGDEMFIANFGSTELAVVDLVTRTKARSLFVDTGGTWSGNPYRLTCATQGRLVFTSEDQWNDLKLIETASGARLHNTGSVYQPDLASSPDGTRIYVAESGSSGSELIRFDLNPTTDQLSQVDNSARFSFGTRMVTMTGDGVYAFYRRNKLLAANLVSSLGSFSEDIYATNQDGSIAIGSSNIHDGTTYGIIRPLPLSTTVMAVSPDASTLYLYDSNSSRIFLFDLGGI